MIALSHIRGIFLRSLSRKVLDSSAHKDNLSVKLLQYGNWTDSFYYMSVCGSGNQMYSDIGPNILLLELMYFLF